MEDKKLSTKSGTNAKVCVAGTTTVLNLASWTVDDAMDALKAPVFGDTNNKVHGMGTRNVSGSISGYLDVDDTTGQDIIKDAYEARTTVSGFRLYIDDTTYFYGDGVATQDGIYITSYNVSAAQNEIIPVEFNFEVSGSWTEG